MPTKKTKEKRDEVNVETSILISIKSGYQDSNLGPPAPKAGALTGLRYTPLFLSDAKVQHFSKPPKKIKTFFYSKSDSMEHS